MNVAELVEFTLRSTIVHVRLFSKQFVLLHVPNLTDPS